MYQLIILGRLYKLDSKMVIYNKLALGPPISQLGLNYRNLYKPI